jgi:hypothetical protein
MDRGIGVMICSLIKISFAIHGLVSQNNTSGEEGVHGQNALE